MESYAVLFAASFLSSSIMPMSSEAMLIGLVALNGQEWPSLVLVATAGNTLGAWSNWLLGRYCLRWQGRRWFPVSAASLDRAGGWFKRYGSWSLLLSWLPVVGDPLTMAAGLLRVNLWLFLALVGLGKAARYLVVAQGVALFR